MTMTGSTAGQALGKLWAVTLDCADPKALGDFWATVLGGTATAFSDDFVGVELPTGLYLGAYRVDSHRAPTWPEGDGPKQFHLDVAVDDLDAGERDVLAIGATKAEHQPEPDRWRVFLDPAGHPFCITNQMG